MLKFNELDLNELYMRIELGSNIDSVIGLFYKKYQSDINALQDSCMLLREIDYITMLFIRSCQYLPEDRILKYDETIDLIKEVFGHFDYGDVQSEIYILFHRAMKNHLKYRRNNINLPFPLGMYVEKFIIFGLRDFLRSQYKHYRRCKYREIEDDELITTQDEEFNETKYQLEEIYEQYSRSYSILKPIDYIYIILKYDYLFSVKETMNKLKIKEGLKSNVFKNITSRIKQFKTKLTKNDAN